MVGRWLIVVASVCLPLCCAGCEDNRPIGNIESCKADAIAGWALGSKITLTLNDKEIGIVVPDLPRPDVMGVHKRHSGKDPGFRFKIEPPAKPGDVVVAVFDGGQPLSNSPCRISGP